MRHGLPDAERIADGQHNVADFERVGIGKIENREFLSRVLDAQHRQVRARVLQDDGRLELAFVGQRHLDLIGAFDDVYIGDDQARCIDDDAGTERALQLVAGVARDAEEAAEDRIVEQRIAVHHRLGGIDIDHGRRNALHHRRIGQPQLGRVRHPPLQHLRVGRG